MSNWWTESAMPCMSLWLYASQSVVKMYINTQHLSFDYILHPVRTNFSAMQVYAGVQLYISDNQDRKFSDPRWKKSKKLRVLQSGNLEPRGHQCLKQAISVSCKKKLLMALCSICVYINKRCERQVFDRRMKVKIYLVTEKFWAIHLKKM